MNLEYCKGTSYLFCQSPIDFSQFIKPEKIQMNLITSIKSNGIIFTSIQRCESVQLSLWRTTIYNCLWFCKMAKSLLPKKPLLKRWGLESPVQPSPVCWQKLKGKREKVGIGSSSRLNKISTETLKGREKPINYNLYLAYGTPLKRKGSIECFWQKARRWGGNVFFECQPFW